MTNKNNRQTGKVVQFERGESLKIDKPLTKNKDFVMLFLESVPLLSSLSKVSRVLLDYIMKYMTRRNLWCNSRSFRSSLYGTTAKKRGKVVMSDKSYRVALDELKKAGVLIDINNAEAQDAFGFNDYDIDTFEGEHYLVNPSIARKGSLKDISQIRVSFEQRTEKQAEEAQRKALAEELRKELDKNRVIVEALEAQRKALEELEPLFVKIRKTPKKRGSSKIRERINAMSNE